MTAPAKQSSRWGALLQQAVAGVESRLDNILAEDSAEGTVSTSKPTTVAPAVAKKSDGSKLLIHLILG